MSVGEALVYGLLGGTKAAADHYVTDWRDRVKRERDMAAQKEGWKYQTSERVAGQEFQSSENEKGRIFSKEERLANQNFQKGQNKEERTFRAGEAWEDRNFRAGQADQDVQRQLSLAQGQQSLTEQSSGLYGFNEKGELIPITPGNQGFVPPVAQMVDGKWQYLTSGKGGKGLLGGSEKGGSSGSGPKSVKSGQDDMGAKTGSIEIDENDPSKRWQYVMNTRTNLWERVPVVTKETAPRIVTTKQRTEAEKFAKQTVKDMVGTFSTDASDFAPWGGSREAAKEYFTQNYLNGTLFDKETGNLIMPGSQSKDVEQPATATNKTATPTPNEEAENASAVLYQQFSPVKQQQVQKFLSAMDEGRDPQALIKRMIELGFTEQELKILFPDM